MSGLGVGVGFVSGLVRIDRLIVGTSPAMSGLCRDVIDVVELVSVRVRRGRFSVGTFRQCMVGVSTCSVMSA